LSTNQTTSDNTNQTKYITHTRNTSTATIHSQPT